MVEKCVIINASGQSGQVVKICKQLYIFWCVKLLES